MARKTTTTTPTNKKDTAGKAKKEKAGFAISATAEEESKPLQASIGEALVAKGTKPVHEVQIVNFDRRLPCALTAPELRDRAQRMKELRRTVKASEALLVTEKEEYDKKKRSLESDISKAEAEINDLADQIGDEAVYRDVRCQRVFDYQLMQVREVRTDTCPPRPLQEPRPMTAREVEEGYTLEDGARQPAAETASNPEPSESEDEPVFGKDVVANSEDESGEIDY